jgi:hypothetical protein
MATLTVTISEELSINGKDRGNSVSVDIASVTNVIDRVVNVTTAEIPILNFGADNGSGQLTDGEMQYLRITNTANSGTCDLRITDIANSKEYLVRIGAGQSYLSFLDSLDVNTSTDVGGAISLSQIDIIKAKASTALDLEIVAVAT